VSLKGVGKFCSKLAREYHFNGLGVNELTHFEIPKITYLKQINFLIVYIMYTISFVKSTKLQTVKFSIYDLLTNY